MASEVAHNVYLLGYTQSIGTAILSNNTEISISGSLSVGYGDISANLEFEKSFKFERVSGTLRYHGKSYQINIENSDIITTSPLPIIAGFLIQCSAKQNYSGVHKQSMSESANSVLKRILKKESDIEDTVDMVVSYLRTGSK
eukprot:NODE_55_length_26219_cov_0.194908.p16 type:complete len:142 gc:universal NODE_55_length_26219_cov_0.194908:16662-17087(+)